MSNYSNLIGKIKSQLVMFSLLFSTFYFAQSNIKFLKLDTQSGLSQNFGKTIIQDKYGFIWIGTMDGLNRYDGYDFTVFNHQESESALTSNFILSSYTDKNKNLWFGTKYGLNKLDFNNYKFKNYFITNNGNRTVKQNSIWAICEDPKGNLWLGTQDGLYKLNLPDETFDEFRSDSSASNSISANFITALEVDTNNNLWIATNGGGLDKLNLETGKFENYNYNRYPDLKSNYINCLYYSKDNPNELIIGTDHGIARLNLKEDKFVNIKKLSKLNTNHITVIKKDNNNLFWIGTNDNGLFSYNEITDEFISYISTEENSNAITGLRITSIFIDNSNLIWLGTPQGVFKLIIQGETFKTYRLPEKNPNQVINNNIFPVIEDHNGILWLGSDDGFNRFDREKNKVTTYRHNSANKNSLSDNLVRAIIEDEENKLWIGNYAGLDLFDPATKKFRKVFPYSDDSKVKIMYLLDDKRGSIWATSDGNGLLRVNKTNSSIINYRHFPGDTLGLTTDHLYPIQLGINNEIWIGTYYGGVLKYSFEDNKISRLKTKNKNLQIFNSISSMAIHQDSTGTLWIGSYGDGLFKYDLQNYELKQYKVEDGLANNVIYGIIEDNDGNLWLSTNNGISRFNIKEESFRNFTTKDGLLSNEFNGNGCSKSPSGEIFFAGINGFISFFPEDFIDKDKSSEVVITDIKLYGESIPIGKLKDDRTILSKSIQETKTIKLSYEDFPLSIEYAALDFRNPNQINYAYKMENLNKNWNYVGNRRFVTYNLPPGEFEFKVITTNKRSSIEAPLTSIKIIVTPPYWDTTLFKIGLVLTLLLIIFALFKLRLMNLNKQKEWLEKNNEQLNKEIDLRKKSEREKELLNIMLVEKNKELEQIIYVSSHDLRAPLVNLQGYSQELKNLCERNIDKQVKNETTEEFYQYIDFIIGNSDKIASLIKGLLEYSRIGREDFVFEKINVAHIIELISTKYRHLIEDGKLEISVKKLPICFGDYQHIKNALDHLIHNSIQFSPDDRICKVSVNGKIEGKNSIYTLSDNGIGIEKDYQNKIFDIFHRLNPDYGSGMGIGLAIVNKIVKSHFGKIEVFSEPGKGTEFILTIPHTDPLNH